VDVGYKIYKLDIFPPNKASSGEIQDYCTTPDNGFIA
jgi:hypothetical protein